MQAVRCVRSICKIMNIQHSASWEWSTAAGHFHVLLHLKLPGIRGNHFPNEFNQCSRCHRVGLLFVRLVTTVQLL